MQKIIVVDNPKSWNFLIEGVDIVSSKEYLTNNKYADLRNVRIFNLSRQYKYQSKGYYVSLLAEAREAAAKLVGAGEAAHMVTTRPQGILDNRPPGELPPPLAETLPPPKPKRGMFQRLFG